MAKLWQRPHAPGAGQELSEADLSNVRIDRPTVVFLPGIFTTHSQKKHIAEGIDAVGDMLARNGEPLPQMLALSHNDLANIFNIVAYNGNPDKAFSRSARQMAEAIILPLVTSGGKPLSENKAAANLRNLTLVGYSAGTVFAQEMYNAARDLMKKAGWAEDRARHVLGEVALIAMASVSRPSREKDRFTTLYLAATNDLAVRLKNRIWRPISRLFSRHSAELMIRRISRTSLLVTARMGRELWEWRSNPDGTPRKAEIAPLLPPRLKVRSNHELPHYMTCDDEHNAFSKVVLHGLINALRRKTRLDAAQLLALPEGLEKNAAEYRARIDSGMRRGHQKDNKAKRGKHDQKITSYKGFSAAALYTPPRPGGGRGNAGPVPV